MTGIATNIPRMRPSVPGEILRETVRRRVREATFWKVQAGVAAVTLIHIGVEAAPFDLAELSIPHVPIVLYVAPIAYAGYHYGLEGGFLTAAWTAVVSIPNVVLWHQEDYAWVGEVTYVIVVVILGVVVSIPVERERRARREAEEVGERVTLLNDVIAALGRSADIRQALSATLDRLESIMRLEGVAVVLDESDGRRLRVSRGARGDEAASVSGPRSPEHGRLVPVFVDQLEVGHLAVLLPPERDLPLDDEEMLTAVAGYIGVAFDNALMHAHEKHMLRSYAAEVTRGQEEERKRMARELHDEVAQALIVLCRDLEEVANSTGTPPELAARLHDVERDARTTLSAVRRFSRDLRPPVLDDLGLVAALRWLAADLSQRTSITATTALSGEPLRLPVEVEIALFRIAQEALRNAERHASPSAIAIEVEFDGANVTVRVRDDGSGFDPEPAQRLARVGSYGIIGMEERAHLLGGCLNIRSHPGAGTEVRVEVPLTALASSVEQQLDRSYARHR